MKKVGLVVIAVSIVLLTCGCGKTKVLTCKQSPQGVDIPFNVGFSGNVIKTMDFTYDLDLSNQDEESVKRLEKQDFCETVKEAMSNYKDAFEKCDHSIKNKKLNVSVVLDVNKIAKTELSKMTTIENAKEGLEKQGYSCTIK